MNSKSHTKTKLLLNDLKEALAGTEQDFTEVKLSRAILLLSVPAVLEMIMESVFVITDIFFVSRLGADAVATVGITESLVMIVYAISIGLAVATTSMISRRIGEKDSEKASITAFQAIFTGVLVSFLIGLPGLLYSKHLLELMGASAIIVEELSGYTRIMLGSNVVIMLLFIINAVFRSSGDAAIAMRILWIGNIINIILDPCLIFGLGPFPEMGITGAAVATTLGRGLAVLYQLWLLFNGRKRVQLFLRHLKINIKIILRLLRLSLGSIGQNLIGTISWIALVRIISIFGSEAVAGYTIAIRVITFILLPSWGISNAASTLVGQNLGAKKPDRAERATMVTGWINMALLGLLSLLFIFYPAFFVNIFINDPGVVDSGSDCLRIISIGFFAYGFGMVLVNAFNGAGDTMTPLKINIFAFWIIEIPLAWFLAIKLGMDQSGVFTAIVLSESIMTLTAWLIFRRGRWKLREV